VRVGDEYVSGYSLGGDGRQLNSIPDATDTQERAAVVQVCRRYRGEKAWETLAMLGLTEVATRMLSELRARFPASGASA
jgi:hypothetical protein